MSYRFFMSFMGEYMEINGGFFNGQLMAINGDKKTIPSAEKGENDYSFHSNIRDREKRKIMDATE